MGNRVRCLVREFQIGEPICSVVRGSSCVLGMVAPFTTARIVGGGQCTWTIGEGSAATAVRHEDEDSTASGFVVEGTEGGMTHRLAAPSSRCSPRPSGGLLADRRGSGRD